MNGDPIVLAYATRDLKVLEAVVGLTPGREVVIQAGGSLGVWPKYLAHAFARVYTFEPDPELFRCLVHNAPEPNIYRYQAALGEAPAFVGLSRARRDASGRASHAGLTHTVGAGAVPTLRLDDFGFPACDLLYLDTEGSELAILKGATATIARCRPVIAVEINKNLTAVGLTPADVIDFLNRLGYVSLADYGSDRVFSPKDWPAGAWPGLS